MPNISTNSQTVRVGLRRMGWYGMLLYLGLLSQVQGATGKITEEAKLTASDATRDASFGSSVALSSDGNTALVGAPDAWQCDEDSCKVSGAAYVFVHIGTWVEQQKLAPSDPEVGNRFGTSVDLSSDGKVAFVGVPKYDGCDTNCGAVYVFVLEGSRWIEQQTLTASDAEPGDVFGSSVALSSNDNLLIVGAPSFPGGGGGKAYVFVRTGNTWIEQQKLTALDTESGDEFGSSVALSTDGNVGLIGAPFNDTVGFDSGAAYVLVREGDDWVTQGKLTIKSFIGSGDYFGSSVALSANGNRALVGAPSFIDRFFREGAAFVFVREGSTWKKQKKLTTRRGEHLGGSVDLSVNGKRALVRGANKKAYVFVHDGVTWVKKYTLAPSESGPLSGHGSVSLSANGKVSLVGAPEANCPGITNCGAAYVFRP